MEGAVEQIARDFDGEDPCVPQVRHTLDHCREDLEKLHKDLQGYVEPFDLPEAGEEELALVNRPRTARSR